MEPANVNPPPDDEVQLAALLRDAQPELPDNGFSVRVLAALPEPVSPRPWRRTAFCLAGALSGVAFTFWQGESWPDAAALLRLATTTLVDVSPRLADPMLAAAFVATAVSLVVAFRAELRATLLP